MNKKSITKRDDSEDNSGTIRIISAFDGYYLLTKNGTGR
jgi:hypothetical protein